MMRSHAFAPGARADAAAWRAARRILAVRLDALGDVLMTTPALHALRTALSARRLDLLTSRIGAALAPHLSDVDEVLTYDAPWMKHAVPPVSTATDELIDTLRARRYDAAVIFTVYSQSPLPAAMLCWLADIPLRIAHARENPYHLLSDWLPEPEPQDMVRHEVQRQLDLVAAVGATTADTGMRFHLRAEDRTGAAVRLRSAGVYLERDWIVLHPGASAASRRYPAERYVDVLQQLARHTDAQLLITGSQAEAPLVQGIAAAVPGSIALAGQLNLGELAATIRGARLLISNNTGPAHLAAALRTPVVDLYALTNPQHTPWQTASRVLYHDVPCRHCYRSKCVEGHHACLRGVPPEAVVEAALELLEETRRRPSPCSEVQATEAVVLSS